MKRLFAILLVLCLALSLAACAADSGAAKEEAAAKPAGLPGGDAAPGEGYRVEAEGLPGDAYYAGKDAALGMDSGIAVPGGAGDLDPGLALEAPIAGDGDISVPAEPPIGIDDPVEPVLPESLEELPPVKPAEALVLTAAEWKDNANWPFFTNLVNGGKIKFPSFGLDPRNRLKVLVKDAAGSPLAHETVTLADGAGKSLWTAKTDKSGVAYLFWTQDQSPERVVCNGVEAALQPETPKDPQGNAEMRPLDQISLTASPAAAPQSGLQVMFIVDTTGSMSDELAYLQKDFSAIAQRVGSQEVQWSVSFYRDEGDAYVTRHNDFSSDVAALQAKLNAEYADGGGDTPEAVAQVLTECLTERADWSDSAAKLAFLIFDAPPHDGKEAELRAAVRSAAERGIRLIPVVASNAERDTELFGRALAILSGGTYVFLTDDSGVGESHLEPIVGDYQVEKLQDLIVRLIEAARP